LKHRFYLLFMAVLASGCASQDQQPPDADTVARVGETAITRQRLDRAVQTLFPGDRAQTPDKERKALERLIDLEVLLLGARERGLENDFEVKSTLAQKEQDLLLEELYRRGVLRGEDQVSNDKARAYFDRHRIGKERRLSRILIANPAAIDQVFSRTHAGEDFAALARDISEDGETAMQGGDIGWMSRLSFKNHILRRQVFAAEVGELIGPIQEPDGFSVMKIVAEREMVAAVKQVMVAQKRAIATFAFLEDLADRAHIQEHGETLQLLLDRLSAAGREMPELKQDERRLLLFTVNGKAWTLDNFMAAMLSERELAEIRTLDDLRLYARRLYAFKILLPQYGREQGLHETEGVAKELERTHRELLLKRLRDTEVIERIQPQESDERAYYEAHRKRYVRPERTSILEVLVDDREQAEKLRSEMEEGGDLDELARRYSKRSTRIRRAGGRMQLLNPDKYGSLGWEAKDAQVGDIVGPVKTNNGYSVFKVLKKIPAREVSFEESIGRVRAHLRDELSQSIFDELLAKLKKQYAGQIQIYEANLSG